MVHSKPNTTGIRPGRGRWLLAGLMVALLACAYLPAAQAQAGSLANRALAELEKTDLVLAKAREWAGTAVSAAARGHYELAVSLQREAWGEYRRGPQYHGRATELTRKAREQALRALDAARIEKKAQDAVRRTMEQAESRVPEVTESVVQARNPRATAVLEQAVEHLRRARRAYLDLRYVQAARLAMLANTLVERAARLARGEIMAGSAAEASLDRTAMLMTQIEVTLLAKGQSPDAVRDYQEAKRVLEQARRQARDGNPQQALRLSLAARERGLRVMATLSQVPEREALAESLADLLALYGEVGADIRSSGSEKAIRQLEQGSDLLRRAGDLLRDGKLTEVQRHTMAAERLLRDAVESAGR